MDVMLANISSLNMANGAVGFQASSGREIRDIFMFGSGTPTTVSSKGVGTGSFTYLVSDVQGVPYTPWVGTTTITVSSSAGSVTVANCTYAGQSTGMSAHGEMTCTVNFSFTE